MNTPCARAPHFLWKCVRGRHVEYGSDIFPNFLYIVIYFFFVVRWFVDLWCSPPRFAEQRGTPGYGSFKLYL